MEFNALECFGCIIFPYHSLLANKFLDIKHKKKITNKILHELTYMWFGNLNLLERWNNILINDAFTFFIFFECLDQLPTNLYNNYNYFEYYFHEALIFDEVFNSYKILKEEKAKYNNLLKSENMLSIKVTCILKMISLCIGKENFKDILTEYILKSYNQNIKANTFGEIFFRKTKLNFHYFMDEWLNFYGHPALYICLSDDKKLLILEQHPFPNNINQNRDDNSVIWKIPLFIRTHEKDKIIFMDEGKRITLDLKEDLNIEYDKLIKKEHFIKINYDMNGFYRVFYNSKEEVDKFNYNIRTNVNIYDSKSKFIELEKSIKNGFCYFENILLNTLIHNYKKLTSIDIVGIIGDYFIINDFSTCFFIIDNIKDNDDYFILSFINKIYNKINSLISKYTPFKELIRDEIIGKKYLTNDFNSFLDVKNFSKYLKINYLELFKIIENLNNNFFSQLINFESIKDKLFDKIFVKDPLCYLNETNDEYLALALRFLTSLNKNDDLINFILHNFENGKSIIHKNLKYEVYHIANIYTFEVFHEREKQNDIFNFILNDYINDYYLLSEEGKEDFKYSILDFQNSTNEKIIDFIFEMKKNGDLSKIYFKDINIFKNFPQNRKKFIDCYIRILQKEISEKKINGPEYQNLENFIQNHSLIIYDMPKVLEDIDDYFLVYTIIKYFYNSLEHFLQIKDLEILNKTLSEIYTINHFDLEQNCSQINNFFYHAENFLLFKNCLK